MYESLDIETIWKEKIARPICIAITKNDKVLFKKVNVDDVDNSVILNFMLEQCSSKKIYYVHNLTFEIFVFFTDFLKNNIKFKLISANRIIYSAEIWHNKKKIRLRCSYRLTMLSLKKLAELAEIQQKTIFPYQILDINLKEKMKINPKMFKSFSEYSDFRGQYGIVIDTYKILEEYCKNDAFITKYSIIKYWKIIEENGLKNNNRMLTAAKLSVENYFSNNFIIKKKIDIKYDRIIRKFYFGGRTEVFGNPEDDEITLHYDWSGMYAQCMCEKVLGGAVVESNIIKDIEHPGFYWIKFTQDLEFPILPIKHNKLLFLNGTFEGWYWFEEILLAIEYGVKIISITKVISSQYYDTFIKNFVEINNNIRKISPLHKEIGKTNNNVFYGRLGMDPDRLEEEIISNIDISSNYEKIIEINGIYIGYKKKEKSISNILISASITSKARIKLYRGIRSVIDHGGRLLYTDTDSIIAGFKKKNYKKNLDLQMGEVFFDSTNPTTIIKDAVFAMPKTYAIKYLNNKEIVKIKGFNSTPTFKEFKEKFYKKDNIVTNNVEWSKRELSIKNINREKTTNLFGLTKRNWDSRLKNTNPIKWENVP